MNFMQILTEIFSNNNIVGVISSSILIIGLGIYLGKKNIINGDASKALSNVVLSVSIPALSFNAFMQNFNEKIFTDGLNLFLWSTIFHVLMIFTIEIFYFKYSGDKKLTLKILSIFGAVTAFGIPIVEALYGDIGIIYASIYSIAYRLFLYSYGFIKMSGMKMTRNNLKAIFLSPVILSTFFGLFIWLFQNYTPQIDVSGNNYSIFRIDKSMFWFYKPLTYLAQLCSPLAWLAAGLKLSEVRFRGAMKSLDSWYYSFVKVAALPLVALMILKIAGIFNILPLSPLGVSVVTIMMATPTASVTLAYAIKYNKEAVMASSCSLLSTATSIVCLPLLIILLQFIN